jgi:hypothetical protein
VHEPDFFRKVICYGNLGMGEAYMAGEFEVCDGGLPDLLTILRRSRVDRKVPADIRLAFRYLGLRLRNLLAGKARNVQRHYDLGDDLTSGAPPRIRGATLARRVVYAGLALASLRSTSRRAPRSLRANESRSARWRDCAFRSLSASWDRPALSASGSASRRR